MLRNWRQLQKKFFINGEKEEGRTQGLNSPQNKGEYNKRDMWCFKYQNSARNQILWVKRAFFNFNNYRLTSVIFKSSFLFSDFSAVVSGWTPFGQENFSLMQKYKQKINWNCRPSNIPFKLHIRKISVGINGQGVF